MDTKVTDVEKVILKLASPEKILSWSHGEVTKPETINYRTQRSERNGLFCEKIFGPEKDWECYCGKYRRIRYKGIICEKCGVEITRSIVRRERMGHISLAVPVSHIWFLRGMPSRMSLILGVTMSDLEKVIYFIGHIVTKVDEGAKAEALKNLEAEYKMKLKNLEDEEAKDKLKKAFTATKLEIDGIKINKVLNPNDYYDYGMKYGGIFEAETGASAIFNIFKNMNLEKMADELQKKVDESSAAEDAKTLSRINLLRTMSRAEIRPEWMFLTVVPVVPPAIRPMVALSGGRHATSDLNDLYRRVINRNNRLKKLMDINAPEVICRNEKRILQEAVDALIDNSIARGRNTQFSQAQRRPLKSLADMLKGKQGRFRQNLLGKRVDYSGRSVIVVGPELSMSQCGLPKHMALELFRPFVIAGLLKQELAYNIRGAGRLIEEKIPEVWAILDEVIKDKYVLLNRAPTLHRLGIQGFRPVLIEGNAIQVHPLVCSAFNADFDGDQMAVHVPLGKEAQEEAKNLIASTKNLLKPGDGGIVVNPSQDIVLGCYWMTKIKEGAKGEKMFFANPNEAIASYDFGHVDMRAKINVLATKTEKYKEFGAGIFETTVGRLLFNSVLPNDFTFINGELRGRDLTKMIFKLIDTYGVDAMPPILDKIKKFGFEYATRSGISWGIDDLKIPEGKKEIVKSAEKVEAEVAKQYDEGLLTNNERYSKVIELWQNAKNDIEKLIPDTFNPESSVLMMVDSQARGTWGSTGQMAGMKGLMVNPSGKTIDFPVVSSYKEGLTVLEYFITTHGARKGEADTALKTATAGYLTRRLVDVAQEVIVSVEDCGSEKGLRVERKQIEAHGKKLAGRIYGRALSVPVAGLKKGHILNTADAQKIDESGVESVEIFSPATCNSPRGVCQKCYGYDLGSNALVKLGEPVGVVAAQAIGEPGTQLTMRTFHGGGIAAGSDITMGLPRVEEIFELKKPKNPAVISETAGQIVEIVDIEPEHEIFSKSKKVVGDKMIVVLIDKAKNKTEKTKEKLEYVIPFGRFPIVSVGQEVEQGEALTDGSFDIKQLFTVANKERAQDYIIHEIDKVYSMQGASINEKHIEIIVKQMFSRRKVVDAGTTNLDKGSIISVFELERENETARKEKGVEAKATQLIKRVKDVATTSPSFLSAASFENTVKVLVRSATKGAVDELLGLKENVILGRLIPVGTGFKGGKKEDGEKENEGEE
jgi:DNA-directed RNA polymerase subunit beta'